METTDDENMYKTVLLSPIEEENDTSSVVNDSGSEPESESESESESEQEQFLRYTSLIDPDSSIEVKVNDPSFIGKIKKCIEVAKNYIKKLYKKIKKLLEKNDTSYMRVSAIFPAEL